MAAGAAADTAAGAAAVAADVAAMAAGAAEIAATAVIAAIVGEQNSPSLKEQGLHPVGPSFPFRKS